MTIIPETIPEHVITRLCEPLFPIIKKFYQSPESVSRFVEWHKKRYGCLPVNMDALNATLEAAQVVV